MKCKPDPHADLKARIAQAVARNNASTSDISGKTGVHQGQVSRIIRGRFQRLSENVMQICNFLGVPVDRADEPRDALEGRLVSEFLTLWDRTPEDAERMLQLIASIRALKR